MSDVEHPTDPVEPAQPADATPATISRRSMLELVALTTLAAACDRGSTVGRAVGRTTAAGAAATAASGPYAPAVFTPHEWDTVRILVDLIIPRDARSGSATEAGVPEFMDRMLALYPHDVLPLRGGLAWLDRECGDRFGQPFVSCSAAQRTAVLDDIAWPARAKPEHSQGVAFFTRFRDFTASGFFSSRVGVEDLQYLGNTMVADWTGCPPAARTKLGV